MYFAFEVFCFLIDPCQGFKPRQGSVGKNSYIVYLEKTKDSSL